MSNRMTYNTARNSYVMIDSWAKELIIRDCNTGIITTEPMNLNQQKEIPMADKSENYSTSVFLIREDVRAVKVVWEKEEAGKNCPTYIYKTFDKEIKVDDYVVVPTNSRHGMAVCKVKEVDILVDIDYPIEIKWIITKFSNGDFLKVVDWEKTVIEKIKAAKAQKKRKDLAKDLAEAVNGAFDEIKALPIFEGETVQK